MSFIIPLFASSSPIHNNLVFSTFSAGLLLTSFDLLEHPTPASMLSTRKPETKF
jgi:hypothetical protein